MSYLDRLQQQITLTSPSGTAFEGKWVGNDRSNVKKLGVFNTPGVRGTIAQDLEAEGNVYPLTIYFDGPDNDTLSNKFFNALGSERGKWSVVHPVHGTKSLQLVDYSESVQPVSSGNITVFNTNWLETIDAQGVQSTAQLSSLTVAQNTTLLDSAKTQFNNVVSLDTADQVGKFTTAVSNAVMVYNTTLKPIVDTVASVQSQADSIIRGINATIDETSIDVLSVAGQLQALVSLPNLVETSLSAKLSTYATFAQRILGSSPEMATKANVNTVATQELMLVSAIGAVGVASVSNGLTSRNDVIDTIESNLALFNTVTDGLDDVQELYSGGLLINSYFSQSESFADSARLVALGLAYLIRSSFDLSVEKRVTITEPTNPVLFAMSQYNGPGDNDENINLFYDSNMLEGQKCLLLPSGKEVVVYV